MFYEGDLTDKIYNGTYSHVGCTFRYIIDESIFKFFCADYMRALIASVSFS